MYCHITLRAVGSFCRAKCSSFSHGLCFPLFYILLWLLHYFIYTFSIYSNSFSIYCSSINVSHSPLPTYYYFKLLPFLLLLRPLTCSIFSQATLNPAQSERKKKESQPETSTPRHIQYRRRHRFENPTSAQVTMFSLSPSVNLPSSVLCSSKFQCLYFKVFVQVLCFDFVCVSMFCK